MPDSSSGFHEQEALLSEETKNRHRAIVSCMEEMEAVDWYDQRVEAATHPELAAILAHNRDEEKEHAAMLLEWLRRNDPVWEEQLKTYLFSSGPILEVESVATGEPESEGGHVEKPADGSLGIGSLRGRGE